MSPDSRNTNWNTLADELDNIGISIDDSVLADIKDGNQAHIDRLFTRIERFSTIIAGPDFLKFETVKAEDLDEKLDDDLIEQ